MRKEKSSSNFFKLELFHSTLNSKYTQAKHNIIVNSIKLVISHGNKSLMNTETLVELFV